MVEERKENLQVVESARAPPPLVAGKMKNEKLTLTYNLNFFSKKFLGIENLSNFRPFYFSFFFLPAMRGGGALAS